jgi:hypothetical protein
MPTIASRLRSSLVLASILSVRLIADPAMPADKRKPDTTRTSAAEELAVLAKTASEASVDTKLNSLRLPGLPPHYQNLDAAQALVRIARRMEESHENLKAVSYSEKTLALIQAAQKTLPDTDIKGRLQAKATTAYLYRRVLHDNEPAYKECLALQPDNPPFKDKSAKLEPHLTNTRIYSNLTPTLNKDYLSSLQAPALELLSQADGSVLLKLTSSRTGTCRVETSTDLIHWKPLFTSNKSDGLMEFRDGNTSDKARFYRVLVELAVE